ncbi:MAG: tyrosine-type recombinase/integrase [Candidatus Obscuribacter sp.]|nr:tyrosine-type recombinase/integrase [Candidatus Obscuribacter sp.]
MHPLLSLVSSNQTVKSEQSKKGGRKTNRELREREYLTRDEVLKLEAAAKKHGRYGNRDALIIRLMYCHGLRVGELVNLKWSQYSFSSGSSTLHVNRLKHGTEAIHPVEEPEVRKLNRWKSEQGEKKAYVFTSERGTQFTTRGVQKIIERAGINAGFDFPVHAHMLRHGKGYELANRPGGTPTRTIQSYLGHRDIRNTVIYTSLSAAAFDGLSSF